MDLKRKTKSSSQLWHWWTFGSEGSENSLDLHKLHTVGQKAVRIMLALQWHEWKHITGILPLLIRCLLQGISAPNALWLIHSLPGMDGAFVFKLRFFYSPLSSITWENPSPPCHALPFV